MSAPGGISDCAIDDLATRDSYAKVNAECAYPKQNEDKEQG